MFLSHTHSLTHSLTHPPTHPPTHSFTQSLTHSCTHSRTQPPSHPKIPPKTLHYRKYKAFEESSFLCELDQELLNYSNSLTRTTKNNCFQRLNRSGFANNKKFWNTVKPFLTKKAFLMTMFL